MAKDVEAGPGWIIGGTDLRPRITDLEMFRVGVADDPLAQVLELLWIGRAARALVLLQAQDQSVRVRALTADCLRDLGHGQSALEIYDALVTEAGGTGYEAVMLQHRGKVHLELGDIPATRTDFQRNVRLRRDGDPALLASAEQALEVAGERERGKGRTGLE